MRVRFTSASGLVMLALTAVLNAGCAIRFIDPPAQPERASPTDPLPPVLSTTVPPRVPVKVSISPFAYEEGSFRVWIVEPDGSSETYRDVTTAFTVTSVAGGAREANGFVDLAAGPGKLIAGACWGVNVVFVMAPNPPPRGCRTSTANVTVVAPRVTLAPTTLNLDAGGTPTTTVNVQLAPPAAVATTVALTSPLTGPVNVSIPAGTAAPVASPPIPAQLAGAASLTANAGATYGTATAALAVRPRLLLVNPTSAAAGMTVTLSGAGFVAPMSAQFGSVSAPATVLSATSATVQVPANAPMQNVQLRVTAAGQQSSASLQFAVLAGATPSLLLFRSFATGVETIRFTPSGSGGTFQLVPPAVTAVAASTGLNVVGLALQGTRLIRSTSNALEEFTVGGTPAAPTLTRAGLTPSSGTVTPGLTGSGTSAALLPGSLVRGFASGIELWAPGSATLGRQGVSPLNAGGAAGAGQSLLADTAGQRVLRSTQSSLEIWDVSAPATPVRLHNNTTGVFGSPNLASIAWIMPGRQLVRSYEFGIEIIDITTVSSRVGRNGSSGGSVAAVAYSGAGNLVVRATSDGLEVYELQPGAPAGQQDPVKCGISREGDTGPAIGVAVVAAGGRVFRTTPSSIEAYNLSGFTCPSTNNNNAITLNPVIFRNGLGPATTGLGLAGPS